jgi:hypothetical protein
VKAWITTKDVLKTGKIREVEGKLHNDRDQMLIVETTRGENGLLRESFWHNEWHDTCAAAIERAEAMRQERIKKLKAELAKLEAMKFLETP